MSWRHSWVARRTAPTLWSRPCAASLPSTRRSSSGAISGATPMPRSVRCRSRARRHHGGGRGPSCCSKKRGPAWDTSWTTPRGTRRGGTVHFPRQDAVLSGLARGLDSHHRHCGGPTCPGWGPGKVSVGSVGSEASRDVPPGLVPASPPRLPVLRPGAVWLGCCSSPLMRGVPPVKRPVLGILLRAIRGGSR